MWLPWYADTPVRRGLQLASDLLALLALVGCLWLGTSVHNLTAELAGPGRTLESAGAGLAGRLADAGSVAEDVPLVGGELSTPFDEASESARSIEDAGAAQQQVVADLADMLGWLSGGLTALVVVFLWLPRRVRFVRQALHVRRLRTSGAGLDLLALRALTHQPLAALSRIPGDAGAGWRSGDREVISALASLELRELGLTLREPR
jgi:hypothetical protein